MLDVWDGGGLAHGRIGVAQFLVGFTLVSIAFPIGRNVTLSVASKIVGPHPQVRVGSLPLRRGVLYNLSVSTPCDMQ